MHVIRLHGPWLATWQPVLPVQPGSVGSRVLPDPREGPRDLGLSATTGAAPGAAPGAIRVRLPGLIVVPDHRPVGGGPMAPTMTSEGATSEGATSEGATSGWVLQRRFNRPTGLLPEQRCYVGCWLEGGVAAAWVNACRLAEAPGEFSDAHAAFRWLPEVGSAYNCLTLVVPWSGQPSVQIQQVALGLVE